MTTEFFVKEAQFGVINVSSVLDFYSLRTNQKLMQTLQEISEKRQLSIGFTFGQDKIYFDVSSGDAYRIDFIEDLAILSIKELEKKIKDANQLLIKDFQKFKENAQYATNFISSELEKIFKETPTISEGIDTVIFPLNNFTFFVTPDGAYDISTLKFI